MAAWLIITSATVSLSQVKSDSLIALIDKRNGLELIDLYYDISYQLITEKDYKRALLFSDKALNQSHSMRDSLRIVKSGKLRTSALRRLEKFNEAIAEYKYFIGIARRNKFDDELKILLNSLAITYTYTAEYDKALKLYFESLIIREKTGNKADISIALNNIGLIYFKMKNYEKALEFYNRALQLTKESGSTEGLDGLMINIGLCYNQLGAFSKSEEAIQQGLLVCEGKCGDEVMFEADFGLGVSNFGQKKYEKAELYFLSSLKRAQESKNTRYEVENLVYLGRVYSRLKQRDKATTTFARAESLSEGVGLNQPLIDTYRELANLYKDESDYENASRYQSKYIHLKDSIYSEELIKNISKVQTEYAERENIKTIASNNVVIKQQRDLNVAIAIIAILAGLLVLVLQRSNRVSKQVNAQLSEAKEIIQEQNKLLESRNKDLDREVAKKTIDLERVNISLKQVNDELDNFIYKTSHDIRGPLASLKGMCNVALMDVQDPVALDYLRKLDATAERLNSILTRLLIINQINNSKLTVTRIDFVKVVNEVLLLEKKKGLPPKLRISKRIDEQATIRSDKELVRIVLENLIDNAIKFYNDASDIDSFVEIEVSQEKHGFVKARVIDNGIGIQENNPDKLFQMFFRASERSDIGGIGLYIVKTATGKIGGKVGQVTTPEGFTEFYILFPPTPPKTEAWAD